MKRRCSALLVATLLAVVLSSASNINPAESIATTIFVPGDYPTIQEAIDHAVEGDTIFVSSGTYHEYVFLNKSISLVGQNPLTTILAGNVSESIPPLVVFDTADAVVMNLTVRDTPSFIESYGILAYRARNLTVQNVTVTDTYYGIMLNNSTHCRIIDNAIEDNHNTGIVFRGNSSDNLVVANLIGSNPTGIMIEQYSTYNVFYRNNMVNNSIHHFNIFPPTYTSWDNGAEGNYWDDYTGTDTDGDGVGDTNPPFSDVTEHPHLDMDRYPLIEPWNATRTYTVESYHVVVHCNYTVASFVFNATLKQASFYITGPSGWTGFCEITIPKALMNPDDPSEVWLVVTGTNIAAHANESLDDSTLLSFNYVLGASMQTNRVRIRTGTLYPPTASFQFSPDPGSTIEPVNFTDTSAAGPNATGIVWRQWNFGDGYSVDNATFVSHQFSSKARFNVTLTVRDNNDLVDSVTLSVWIRNLPPAASFSFSPTTSSVGVSVRFNASDSTDRDGDIAEYRWNFGDSAIETTANTTVTHTFAHVGTYNVTLTAVDSDGGEDETAHLIQVGKGATTVELNAPAGVHTGEPLTLAATLRDAEGHPLAGKLIRFEVSTSGLDVRRNVNTDSLGTATTTLSLNQTGQYTVTARYDGSTDYWSSERTSSLEVRVATTLYLQVPETATQNTEITVSATLVDDLHWYVPGRTIEFYIRTEDTSWEWLDSVQTDGGTASFTYTPTQTGTFTLQAIFMGDAIYAASTSSEHSFTVAPSEANYLPYVVLAAIAAIVGFALATVFARRKGKSGSSG